MKNTAIGNFIAPGFLLAVCFVSASNVSGQEQTGQSNAELVREAKYTFEQARKIALLYFPGKIESEKLEKKNGIFFYSFEIRDSFTISVNVRVDAITGKILSSEDGKEKSDVETISKSNKPNMVSNIKNGTVKGVKIIGRGIQTAANRVVGIFTY